MSFKIIPNHDRIFNTFHSISVEVPVEDLVEETVFLIDEETGEIVEERQMVPREPSSVPPTPVIVQPPKDNKFIGFSMRKKTKMSFM